MSTFCKCYLTLDITIFSNSFSAKRDYECQILLCQILIVFRCKNNSPSYLAVLPKGVLIDLHACNFVQAITSLCARCAHARHCACNLLRPI